MTDEQKTIELTIERVIPATADELFDGWLDAKTPGTPWSMAEKLLLNPHVDGFFYWLIRGNAHYGRFTEVIRPSRIEHTWMSRSTGGEESFVTIIFEPRGDHTLMTLVHSGLPATDGGRGHEKGWNFILDAFAKNYTEIAQ